jgi:hypothetical protein
MQNFTGNLKKPLWMSYLYDRVLLIGNNQTRGNMMTDLLPPPPGEIIVEDVLPNELAYINQGKANHEFYAKIGSMYHKMNVYQYEVKHRQVEMQRGMIQEFEASLKEAIAQDEIHADVAQTFADIFDINLKRSYEFTVNVEYTFSVELDAETSPDDVVDGLNFEVSERYGSDYNLDNVDYCISGSLDYVEM